MACRSWTADESPAGCSKRLSSKAAASEEARRTLRCVEPLSEARTPLADFFSILLIVRAAFIFCYERRTPIWTALAWHCP